jgi:hypothetical protein
MNNDHDSSITAQYTGDPSDGLFTQLTRANGTNPVDSGLIAVKGPTRFDPFMMKSAILGHHKQQSFYNYATTFPKYNQNWVEFDFFTNRIMLTAYAIRACDRYVMQSWNIIGSNDHKTWALIDLVRDANVTKDKQWRVFTCSKKPKSFRYIRYVQHANSERDEKCQYFIQIAAIEFFGTVIISGSCSESV